MNRKDQKTLLISASVIVGLTIISMISINFIVDKISKIHPKMTFEMSRDQIVPSIEEKSPPPEMPKMKNIGTDDQFLPPMEDEPPGAFRRVRNGKDAPDIKHRPPPSGNQAMQPPPMSPEDYKKRGGPPQSPSKGYPPPPNNFPGMDDQQRRMMEEEMPRSPRYDYQPPSDFYPPPPPEYYYDERYDYDYYDDYYNDLEGKVEGKNLYKKVAKLDDSREMLDLMDMDEEDEYLMEALEE